MAAPRLGLVRYTRHGEIGACYTASSLRRKLLEGEVQHLGSGIYKGREGNRNFELHCIDCHGLECESSKINKLGEFGGRGTGHWQQFFVHSSVQQHNHNHTCECVEANVGGGGGPFVKRRFLESRLYIPTQRNLHPETPFPLVIEFDRPEFSNSIDVFSDNFELFLTNIAHLSDVVMGQEEDLYFAKAIVQSQNGMLPRHNFDFTDEEYYSIKNFDLMGLEYRCWHKNLDNELEPIPISINHSTRTAKMTYPQNSGGEFYIAVNGNKTGARDVYAPVYGGQLLPLGKDFDKLVEVFHEQCNEEGEGYSLETSDPEIDVCLFYLNENVRFLHIQNRADESKRIELGIFESGDRDIVEGTIQDEERPREYIGQREGDQFINLTVQAQAKILRRIRLTGNVRFEVRAGNRLIFSQVIDAPNPNNRISISVRNEPLNRNEFAAIVQNIYPDYTPIVGENDSLNLVPKDWIDFDRFMFTKSLDGGEDEVAVQGITLRNKRLLSFITSFDSNHHDNFLDESSTLTRFSKMFESNYIPIVEEDNNDLSINVRHRLVPTETYGYFGPHDSDYKWLIDHRSWSQLSDDNPELEDGDVIFLSTGHRLIRTEAIARYDCGEIDEIEYFEQFNQNPADVLVNAFQYTTEKDQEERFNRLHNAIMEEGSQEFTFKPENNGEQPEFRIWSNRDFAENLGLGYPWSRASEPTVLTVDDSKITLHRVVIEGFEGQRKHNFYLVKRTEGEAPKLIRIFKSDEYNRPHSTNIHEWELMTRNQKFSECWNSLRTHIRAFMAISSGGQLSDRLGDWRPLLDYITRIFLTHQDESPIPDIRELDPDLSNHIRDYVLSRMWIGE